MRKVLDVIGICIVCFAVLVGVLSNLPVKAQNPDSLYTVHVYKDLNGNGNHDDGEEVDNVNVIWRFVYGKVCENVTSEDALSGASTNTAPFLVAGNKSCIYYSIERHGTPTFYRHDAAKSLLDGIGATTDLWLCDCDRQYLPLVLRTLYDQ